KLGRTITYAQLAKEVGKPNAARAVGNAVIARLPNPLLSTIIPARWRTG
ncbi:MAG: MGMT family protein, partial [Sedimentisphaerales bacterium]|nr:MGMT family protein [Sedimentisphaerales bacterium]